MADYPMAPWLQPAPDPGQQYVHAFSAGAQVAEAQARLQEAANRAQVETEMRRQENEKRFAMEQQRLEIGKEYQNLSLGLEKQKLDDARKLTEARTREAAQKYAARQHYQQLIDSGMDPAQALLAVGPQMGMTMTSAAQLYKAGIPKAPPDVMTTPQGNEYLWDKMSGVAKPLRTPSQRAILPGSMTALDKSRLQELQRQRALADKTMDITNPTFRLEAQAEAKKRGIPLGEAATALKTEALAGMNRDIQKILYPPTQPGVPGTAAREVIRRTKDGRRAVFNADTKEFIRYAD